MNIYYKHFKRHPCIKMPCFASRPDDRNVKISFTWCDSDHDAHSERRVTLDVCYNDDIIYVFQNGVKYDTEVVTAIDFGDALDRIVPFIKITK